MDPALQQVIEEGSPQQEIEALIRLRDPAVLPQDVRPIAFFGNIVTVRLPWEKVREVWSSPDVISVKATRIVAPPPDIPPDDLAAEVVEPFLWEAIDSTVITGKGSILGFLDWGYDFSHPWFLNKQGNSRFLAIWDQGAPYDGQNKYGYGRVITRQTLNRALKTEEPFQTAGYHPDPEDSFAHGTHGTHVCGIAARIAPDADLVGVHLSTGKLQGTHSLGDSVRIVEGLDFILNQCQGNPCSINMSVGSSAGSDHSGRSLVEQAIDACLTHHSEVGFTQSCGNYYASGTHASGHLSLREHQSLPWIVEPVDPTTNELEIWYPGEDELEIRLYPPDSSQALVSKPGENTEIRTEDEDEAIGKIYHRRNEPNTNKNHVDIFLYPNAPGGTWQVELVGLTIEQGDYHAWIERDVYQSRFADEVADQRSTIGTIAGPRLSLTVGAYNSHHRDSPMASFSSAGPTTDSRTKPEIIAPGIDIMSAISSSSHESRSGGEIGPKSGTSMAAPHVAGAIALAQQAAGRPLSIEEIRHLLFESATPYPNVAEPRERFGYGILNIKRLIIMANSIREPTEKLADNNSQSVPLLQEQNAPKSKAVPPVSLLSEPTYESREGALAEPNWQESANIEPLQAVVHQSLVAEINQLEAQTQLALQSLFRDRKWPENMPHFELVAGPGEVLTQPVQDGDILIRQDRGQLLQSRIVAPLSDNGTTLREVAFESRLPGIYAIVAEKTAQSAPVARRLTNARRYLPLRQAILRPRSPANSKTVSADSHIIYPAEEIPSSGLAWPGAPEAQLTFMRRVYDINLQRSAQRGTFIADVPGDELDTVEGRFQLRTTAAQACHQLLQAARADINRAQVNVQVGLTSAYRSASHQFRLWQRYFPGYYQETRQARQRLSGGEYGEQAAQYLARYVRRRIATPGFSNHNNGLAVDLLNQENGQRIPNSSRTIHIQRWHNSWFWRWLTRHAAGYGFYQNTSINEPWHWEYRGRPERESSENDWSEDTQPTYIEVPDFLERISVDDVAAEMNSLRCQFLILYQSRQPSGTTRTFHQNAILFIQDWQGTNTEALIDGFPVPKLILTPYVDRARNVRRYEVGLANQRTAVQGNMRQVSGAREREFRRNRATWERELRRLEGLLSRRQRTYSRMFVRQMMYNRFDISIAHWTNYYNRQLRPATPLDPNIVKSILYQESRMGTSGIHLMPPPYDWNSGNRHPIKSRFNLGQAIDSFGPQQWLMMREMAPTIFSRHGLDALATRRQWFGMSMNDYWTHPTFRIALREFFTHRTGVNNLMGTPNRDLHEDYGFWIRTAIRWLFVKYQTLRTSSWPEAVRAYNGGGARARRYRDEVMARVGSLDPLMVGNS